MADNNFGQVIIGPQQIYDQLIRLTDEVAKLSSRVEQIGSDVNRQQVSLSDHEARIRILERARWPLPALAGLVSLGSLVLAVLAYLTRK